MPVEDIKRIIDLKSAMAPIAVADNNVYVVWWNNETVTDNNEIFFRASTDGGQTFGDKINLSNTADTDSVDAEIDSDADCVVVTWWETNQTDDTPVMRISNDNGAMFGPSSRSRGRGIGSTVKKFFFSRF